MEKYENLKKLGGYDDNVVFLLKEILMKLIDIEYILKNLEFEIEEEEEVIEYDGGDGFGF